MELTSLKEIIQLLYLIGGLIVAIFIFLHIAPRIQFSVSHWWPAGVTDICVLKVAITNVSHVLVKKERVLLQVRYHTLAEFPNLTEWIKFDESAAEVFTSTDFLYPGETISVERPIPIPHNQPVAHVGVQFHPALSKFWALVSRVSGRKLQWTTTFFLVSSNSKDATEDRQQCTPAEGN